MLGDLDKGRNQNKIQKSGSARANIGSRDLVDDFNLKDEEFKYPLNIVVQN